MDSLLDKLQNNKKIPMHMPGHKRNTELSPFLKELRADLDITEIDGFDNLAHPEEILEEYMEKASELWKSAYSYLLVGGSTCGILAGLRTLTKEGDTVLMCRSSHKSVYHALELCGLNSKFIEGEIYNTSGKYSPINPKDIEHSIENSKIDLVMITSPLYEGVLQPVSKIAEICHKHNIPLMVDEAHGSHLGFTNYFSGGAVQNGADLVVQSLHKTLLGFTQTGILHVNGSRVDKSKLEHNLAIFQTSSPSYILLASICECIKFLNESKTAFKNWEDNLEQFYIKSKSLKYLIIPYSNNRDKSKILIDCSKANINGKELMSVLREKYNIELEMAYADCALAMTGLGETSWNLECLINALLQIDSTLSNEDKEVFSLKDFESTQKLTIKETLDKNYTTVSKEEAIGEISSSHIWVYPPGVPVIIAGEMITEESIKMLDVLEQKGCEILDGKNIYPKISVIELKA